MTNEILQMAQEVLQDSTLTLDSPLAAAEGCDSLNLIQFSIELEKKYSVSLEEGEIDDTLTVGKVAELIMSKQ